MTKAKDLIYDIETYRNLFSITYKNVDTGKILVFEMSPWKNDWRKLIKFTKNCSNGFVRWVGYNNYGFDYPVIHYMLKNFGPETDGATLALHAHKKGTAIIRAPKDEGFQHIIWDNHQMVPQVDLYKIHHFDNAARRTSLKVLEFNMRSKNIKDLPYDPEKDLTYEQAREVLDYNIHDVEETYSFYLETIPMIRFREELTERYDKNFLNHNDTKIGKDYFIMELEKADIKCFKFGDDGRKPIQSKRPIIRLREVVFPYVRFKRPEFNAVLKWINRQEIKQTKGVFTDIDDFDGLEPYINIDCVKFTKIASTGRPQSKFARTYKFPSDIVSTIDKINYLKEHYTGVKITHLHCVVDGFQFDFGTGGIHGSISANIIEEDPFNAVLDYDVTSLYPSIGIVNNLFPEHLTKLFCKIYANLKKQRVSYAKGTLINAMLKLALNGVYGDSNNPYSPFYDPKYTMAITINGQLMMCMLAEMYLDVKGLEIIQINTDGLTVKTPRSTVDEIDKLNYQWEFITKLDLERADYKKMYVRDVNNYIGEYTNDKLKRKGAYEYEVDWHQNHSSLVIQKAVEAYLVQNIPLGDFIRNHDDKFDFMLRMKVDRTSRLEWGGETIQNITRYYVSKDGKPLVKIMPPHKNKMEKGERHFKQHKIDLAGGDQWAVMPVNEMPDVLPTPIDYDWYINEAQKLITPMENGVLATMMT